MPNHKHDCDNCTFIKTLAEADYYICLHSGGADGSLIKRYSSEGNDYASHNLADILGRL